MSLKFNFSTMKVKCTPVGRLFLHLLWWGFELLTHLGLPDPCDPRGGTCCLSAGAPFPLHKCNQSCKALLVQASSIYTESWRDFSEKTSTSTPWLLENLENCIPKETLQCAFGLPRRGQSLLLVPQMEWRDNFTKLRKQFSKTYIQTQISYTYTYILKTNIT